MPKIIDIPFDGLAFQPGFIIQGGGAVGPNSSQAINTSVLPGGIPGSIFPSQAPDGRLAMQATINATDGITYGKIRSEMDCDKGPTLVGDNAERWYVWDMYLPLDWYVDHPIIVQQMHDDPDPGEPIVRAVNFSFTADATRGYIAVPRDAPNELTSSREIASFPLVIGRWVQCVLHVKWAEDSSGFLEVGYDGQRIVQEWNRANGYPDIDRPYFKMGLYDTAPLLGQITSHTAFYSNLAIWEGRHNAAEVLGYNLRPQPSTVKTGL